MTKPISNKSLQIIFLTLVFLAVVGFIYTSVLRKTPAAYEPNINELMPGGVQLTSHITSPGSTDDTYSNSSIHTLKAITLQPPSLPFKLELAVVHSREWIHFDIEMMSQHLNFPSIDEPEEVTINANNTKKSFVLIGYSGEDSVLQSCIVSGGISHISQDGLMSAVNSQRDKTLMNRIFELFGTKPNTRWECLLVSISIPKKQASKEALLFAWNSIYSKISANI